MTNAEWDDVDRYLEQTVVGSDDADVLRDNAAAGLPTIDVSPAQAKFLYVTALAAGARRILEIGTLGGFSTLWLARAVGPDGRVVTLEYEPQHAEVARKNLDRKGVGDRVDIRVGPALDSLAMLAEQDPVPFDLVFIDADKVNNSNYVQWALRLTRPGAVLVIDNVIRRGAIATGATDAAARASREVLELLAAEPRLEATALQTVGAKGWDGFAYAVVTG